MTGGAGFLGAEQGSWAQVCGQDASPDAGPEGQARHGDAPVEQGPSAAQTVAQKFIANKNVVAVLGASTSGSVAATSRRTGRPASRRSRRPRRASTLTKGDNQEATRAFFRVVPADDYQGPTDANYMINKLKVKNVVVFDFQEPYSQGLAGEVEKTLKAAGVTDEPPVRGRTRSQTSRRT